MLIDYCQIISIWCRFLFGVSEDDIADGPACATAEGAALGGNGVGYFRLDDIRVIWAMLFESAVLGEAELARGVSPSGHGLIPFHIFFWHGDMCVVHED